MATTEKDMQDIMFDLLYDGDEVKKISSFAEVGMLTMNKGVVITMKDGSEFQITIVQSKEAK